MTPSFFLVSGDECAAPKNAQKLSFIPAILLRNENLQAVADLPARIKAIPAPNAVPPQRYVTTFLPMRHKSLTFGSYKSPMNHGLTLLFGMPRSGTTWIAKIFDSHPDTLYRHEPDSGGTLNTVPFYPKVDQWEKHRGAVQAFVSDLSSMNSSRVAGSLPVFHKNYCSNMRLMFQRASIMTTRASEKLGWQLPILAIADQTTRVHVVWKSIESTGRLGLIARALPECRAILILRHPCAYIASVLSGESQRRFTDPALASEDYEIFEWLLAASRRGSNRPSLDALKALKPVERLAWLWVLTNEKALADIAEMENCTYVRYEDVCAEPFAKAWEMLNFAGLLWDPQVENFIRQSTSRHSDRYYSVFKDPAVTASRWRSDLSEKNTARILKIVRESRLRDLYAESSAFKDIIEHEPKEPEEQPARTLGA